MVLASQFGEDRLLSPRGDCVPGTNELIGEDLGILISLDTIPSNGTNQSVMILVIYCSRLLAFCSTLWDTLTDLGVVLHKIDEWAQETYKKTKEQLHASKSQYNQDNVNVIGIHHANVQDHDHNKQNNQWHDR